MNFGHLGRGEVLSFERFVEAFCRKWSPNYHEKCIPIAERLKEVYGAQNPIEQTPNSHLEDDEGIIEA